MPERDDSSRAAPPVDLVLAGDSHTLAFQGALDRMTAAEREGLGRRTHVLHLFLGHENAEPFCALADDRITFHREDVRQVLEAFTGREYMCREDRAAVWGFSVGLMTTQLVRGETWRRFVPWASDQGDGRRPLSDGVIGAVARAANRHVREFFSHLVTLEIDCFCIAAPPLSAFEPALERGVSVMLEVDRIARNAMAAELEELGVRVVWPPDQVYEGAPRRSLLRSDLAVPGDTHHANATYGRIMLEQIVAKTSDVHPWLLLPPLGRTGGETAPR